MDPQFDTGPARTSTNMGNGFSDFILHVEDLTRVIKDIDTPEIARVRAKVKMALTAAKSALSDSASQLRSQARQATQRTDSYVRDNPWQVVGIAAVVGIVLAMLLTRRAD